MPLHRRLPKRGFTNLFRIEYRVVNVERLNALTAGSVVDPRVLQEAGLLRKGPEPVKILGGGTLSVPLTIRAHRFAAAALKKIEAAGGKAETIEARRGKREK
jgi:large subunit ribosomal protein L15